MQNTYLFPGEDKQAMPPYFEIKELKELSQEEMEEMGRLQTLKHFQLMWIMQGRLIQLTDGQEHLLERNCMHGSIPGQLQQLIMHGGTTGYLIVFNETFLYDSFEDFNGMQEGNLLRMFAQCPPLSIPAGQSADMEGLALKMLKENNNEFLFKNEVLSKYLKVFLIYVRRQMEATATFQNGYHHSLFNHFLSLLENNYKQKKAVADYARALAVTPGYLNDVIKKTSGYPASHHIQQRIVLEAKRKATHTGASMKEVAYYLGFNDIYHFSKFFKSSSGMNFTAFKNSNRPANA